MCLIGLFNFPRLNKVVRVTILSGQHLPNSAKKGDIVDPYVQLKVRGHPLDKQKHRTKVVKNNGKFFCVSSVISFLLYDFIEFRKKTIYL